MHEQDVCGRTALSLRPVTDSIAERSRGVGAPRRRGSAMRGRVCLWMVTALLAVGCGGDSETDAGPEDAAIMDAGADAAALPPCERNRDCDDGL